MRWSSLLHKLESWLTNVIFCSFYTKNISRRTYTYIISWRIFVIIYFFHFFFFVLNYRLLSFFWHINLSSNGSRDCHELSIKIDLSSKTFRHRFAACDELSRRVAFRSPWLRALIYLINLESCWTLWSNDFHGINDWPYVLEEPVIVVKAAGRCERKKKNRNAGKNRRVVEEPCKTRRLSFVSVAVEYETFQPRSRASLLVLTTSRGWAKGVRLRFLRDVFDISAGGRRKSQRRVDQKNQRSGAKSV